MKVYACFEDISHELLRLIRSANSSVIICVAWINFDLYGPALKDAVARGVNVEVLLAESLHNKTNPPPEVPFYRLRMRDVYAIMHNKFCVIDGRVVVTGSYNWSRMASRHFENIVIIENSFDLALSFMREFEELKDYFFGYKKIAKNSCGVSLQSYGTKVCASESFLVGILGPEEGKYESSEVSFWNVCTDGHVSLAAQRSYQFLSSALGLKDDPSFDEQLGCGEDVGGRLKHERQIVNGVRSFLDSHGFGGVRAIGRLQATNWNEHIKWNEPLEHEIFFFWRDSLYRKVIPECFPQDGEYVKIFDNYLT